MAYTWTATLWEDHIATVDHTETGLARLIWQYRGEQPRLQAFLEVLLDQLQSIEDVTYDVLVGIWPLTAIGEQLDMIGSIVNQDRGSLTDAEYRMFIIGRIFVNHMTGPIPEFYELLEILGITETIYMDEGYPSYVRFDCTDCEYGELIGQLMHDGKPAGIDMLWIYNDEIETDSFAMSDTPGSDEVNINGGYSNIAGTVGGKYSGSLVK